MSNRLGIFGTILVFAIVMSACTTTRIEKAALPSGADPQTEIDRLQTDLQMAHQSHADLFANKDFERAQDRLQEAKTDFQNDRSREQILEKVAYGRGYLNRALVETNRKINPDSGIVRARQAALDAGVLQNSILKERFEQADEDLRDATNNFDKALPANRLANFQRAYLNLELWAIKSRHLGIAQAQIRSAQEEGAERRAPKSLRRALLDFKEAENEIMADRHAPGRFEPAVLEARESAQNLIEVMRVLRNSQAGLTEDIAMRMINQNRTITGLRSDLESTQSQLGEANTSMSELNQSVSAQSQVMATQSASLQDAERKVKFQQALERARGQFSEDEAEVYQQGDRLIIRLKKVNFPSGQASLKESSEELLDRVRSVASDLAPVGVTVEGHTDSTGSAEVNRRLSSERAEVVAGYLSDDPNLGDQVTAVGRSDHRPIAPNTTAEGRALNRRVDIVIEPLRDETGATSEAATSE